MPPITNLTLQEVKDLVPSYVSMYSGTLAVQTSTIPNAGNGCFATTNIANGTLVGTYAGFTHDHIAFQYKRIARLYSDYTVECIEADENNNKIKHITINGLHGGNELRYINDCSTEPSISPNVYLNSNAEVYAISDIATDDELFLDYTEG